MLLVPQHGVYPSAYPRRLGGGICPGDKKIKAARGIGVGRANWLEPYPRVLYCHGRRQKWHPAARGVPKKIRHSALLVTKLG